MRDIIVKNMKIVYSGILFFGSIAWYFCYPLDGMLNYFWSYPSSFDEMKLSDFVISSILSNTLAIDLVITYLFLIFAIYTGISAIKSSQPLTILKKSSLEVFTMCLPIISVLLSAIFFILLAYKMFTIIL